LIFSIKLFANLREDILSKVTDTLDEVSYADGEFIVRQGAKGDTFYIVSKGKRFRLYFQLIIIEQLNIGRAQITQGKSKWDTPQYVRHLERGEFFGEPALQS
jgi:cGMP-dependent protein kinase